MRPLYYACSELNNFGDYLSKWLADKLTGDEFKFSEDADLIISGSVLKRATDKTHVFGAGFMNMFEKTNCPNIHYVRGEFSRQMLKTIGNQSKPELFEPAFCLREYYENRKPDIDVGFVPHYVDWDKELHPEWHHIGICTPMDDFIKEVLRCKKIVTSSLHAMVLADLFERKNALVRISDKIVGDGFKYLDYWSFAGMKYYKPISIGNIDLIKDKLNTPVPKFKMKKQAKQFINDLSYHLNQTKPQDNERSAENSQEI